MKIDPIQDEKDQEIEKFEILLHDFQKEWDQTKAKRSSKWRNHFLLCFISVMALSIISTKFLWLGLIVIAYFAGSLYSLLRQNAKTSYQIIEHKKQLQLIRLLRNFETSPYSQK